MFYLKILAFPLALVKSIIEKSRIIVSEIEIKIFGSAICHMTIYVLICLSLSLAGVAGLQFFYLTYLERMDKETRRALRETERENRRLKQRLFDAQMQITEQAKLLEAVYDESEKEDDEEEIWADVIEDR